MRAANSFIFFKEISPGITVDFDLTDQKLKRFYFARDEKNISFSASCTNHSFNLVYVCFEKGSHICNDSGIIPEKNIYNTITAIVNDFLG